MRGDVAVKNAKVSHLGMKSESNSQVKQRFKRLLAVSLAGCGTGVLTHAWKRPANVPGHNLSVLMLAQRISRNVAG